VLEVEGVEEERADEDAGGAEHHRRAHDQRADPPGRRRHERALHRALDAGEAGEQPGGDGEQREAPRRAPTVLGRPFDRVDEHHQAGDDGRGARQVEPPAAGADRAERRNDSQRHERSRHADRDVDEEDPLPAEPAREHAAEQHARRRPGAADRGPNGERPGVLRARVGRDDDRERCRGEHRGSQALDGAGRYQCRRGPRQPAGQRRGGEDEQAGEEDTAAPEQVCRPAADLRRLDMGVKPD
jgi:hypothetical protein